MSMCRSIGSLEFALGTYPKASLMAAMTAISSSLRSFLILSFGPGLRTQRITNSPIMHMIKSASVKIHSGHSSQISWGSHFLQAAAMGVFFQRGGAEGGTRRSQRGEEGGYSA